MCNIKRDETWAASEHIAHTRHISGIEISNIKRDETWAAIEHIAHILYIRCIEMCNIKRDETWAASEHIAHILYIRCIEMSNVEFCEPWARTKHISHTRHIPGIEMCNIKRGEWRAESEHIAHIRHILGIKILYAFYLLQFNEILEPRITTRRSCIGKRGLEHNLGNVIFVSVPCWQIFVTIECILIFAPNLLVSTTESQRAVSIFHPRAVIISLVTEVSAIYLGIGLIAYFNWFPIYVTGERATPQKHVFTFCHSSSFEFVWRIDSLQVGTATEH